MTVTDAEMISATKMIFERMKLVVEPAAGAALAAALKLRQDKRFPNMDKVGVILCGGNVDMDKLPWI